MKCLEKEITMKLSVKQHVENFKAKYGEGEVQATSNGFSLPVWLVLMLLHLSGIKSKKRRVQKKIVKEQFNKLLEASIKNQSL